MLAKALESAKLEKMLEQEQQAMRQDITKVVSKVHALEEILEGEDEYKTDDSTIKEDTKDKESLISQNDYEAFFDSELDKIGLLNESLDKVTMR